MAEEIEIAQKALRAMDYDSMLEDVVDEEEDRAALTSPLLITSSDFDDTAILPFPEVSSASSFSLERFLSSIDINESRIKKTSEVFNIDRHKDILFDNTQLAHTTATRTNTTPTRPLSMSASPPKPLDQLPIQSISIDDDNLRDTLSVELQTFETFRNKNDNNCSTKQSSTYAGTAGFLEMEKEPPREFQTGSRDNIISHNSTPYESESIKTDSGLILKHRKMTNLPAYRSKRQQEKFFYGTQQNRIEVENCAFDRWNENNVDFYHRKGKNNYFTLPNNGLNIDHNGKHSMVMVQFKRIMSYVTIWIALFVLILLVMTGIFFHSMGHEEVHETSVSKTHSSSSKFLQLSSPHENKSINILSDEVLLLPLTDSSNLPLQLSQERQQQYNHDQLQYNFPRILQTQLDISESGNIISPHQFLQKLRQEFEMWMKDHKKTYHGVKEKEYRFSIWSQNHRRTAEKNSRHGPCTLTKQHVFGSNQFKDLAPEEFQKQFLTGYKGAFTDVLEKKKQDYPPGIRKMRKDFGIGMVLNPKTHTVKFHESVARKQRHLKLNSSQNKPQFLGISSMYCKWYDISCVLRYVWQSTGIQFGTLVGTMEPKYDADAFPNAVDWRDSGAVTNVRTQGECGACWAVTAVETVESACFIATGTLYELSESEIIVCDDSCEMCSGGWPQNAYEWVMDHGGLPLQSTLPYDAYTLIALTAGLDGQSEYYDEETVDSYRAEVCPANDDSRSGSHSNDNSYWEDGIENENYVDYSEQGRYGNIKGYGYATDRCLCYTDGSGCDCDDQDEDTAVRNIATYGPAVVCLEASTWQDYAGGIMTSNIGCGQEFLDMNHCVQVVGYAFTTSADCNGEGGCKNSQDTESGSGSKSYSRSSDSNGREGYWIVRNQWGENWGMNGYAYVSMGENTCGILNDMTIAYA